jgi:Carboxypeptidase regulatory-like domain
MATGALSAVNVREPPRPGDRRAAMRTIRGPRPALLLVVGAIVAAACSGGAGTTVSPLPGGSGPLASAGGGASGAITIRGADDAAGRVLTQVGRWPGLGPFDPNRIGQCCGYRVQQTADGWAVTIEVGWDDCPAGCISRHQWHYGVHPDGTIVDLGETGPAVPAGLPGAEAVGGSPAAGGGPSESLPPMTGPGVRGIALAGPTCPVARPNDPGCADRPVAGAIIHVLAADGTEVATVTTDGTGRFQVPLEAGAYRLVADQVSGLMGTAPPVDVTVTTGAVEVRLSYDTGIR